MPSFSRTLYSLLGLCVNSDTAYVGRSYNTLRLPQRAYHISAIKLRFVTEPYHSVYTQHLGDPGAVATVINESLQSTRKMNAGDNSEREQNAKRGLKGAAVSSL